MDMKEIQSIWDGWMNQSVGPSDHNGGNCAYMYIVSKVKAEKGYGFFPMLKECDTETRRRINAVGEYIAQAFFKENRFTPCAAIFHANDVAGFTPEKFREIDRMLEYQRIQNELAAQVDSVQVNSPVEPEAVYADIV